MSLFEHSLHIGNGIGCILYGINVSMYYNTLHNIRKSKTASQKKRLMTCIVSTTFLALLSVDLATNAVYGEQAWITFQGHSSTWLETNQSVWYETIGTASLAVLIFISDAFQVSTSMPVITSTSIIIASDLPLLHVFWITGIHDCISMHSTFNIHW